MITIAIDARMVRSSGIGTFIDNIARRLTRNSPEWRFLLLGDRDSLSGLSWTNAENIRIVHFPAPLYSVREQLLFPRSALADCQVLWSPNYNFAWRWDRSLLVTVHDVAHLALVEIRASVLKHYYARSMFAALRKRADAVAFVSNFSALEFQRYVGVLKGRKLIIPCGVDESWFGVRTPSQTPYILFVGNVKPHKNLSRLLDAFASVCNDLPHDLRIVGRRDGFITGDASIADRIGEFGKRVTFTGHISDDALRQQYAGADALILPSLYEGFGLTPIEAMAAGCPALVSRAGALPDTCGDAALYCDPLSTADIAAQIRRILTDAPLRNDLRSKGLQRARMLSWDVPAAEYRALIESLLK